MVNTNSSFHLVSDEELTYFDQSTKFICHHGAVLPLQNLIADAREHGFDIKIVSAYRSFERQAEIVLEKFTGRRVVLDANEQPLDIQELSENAKIKEICRFSALPGFSRHHLGTDFDIYPSNLLPSGESLKLTAFEYEPGNYFYPFSNYLKTRLEPFGFYLPYVGVNSGLSYEPWHISYRSLADKLLSAFNFDKVCKYIASTDLIYKDVAIEFAKAHYKKLLACE